MEALNQSQRYGLVGQFFSKNWTKGQAFTVNHFKSLRMSKPTVYRIISRWEQDLPMARLPGSAGKVTKMTKIRRLGLVRFSTLKVGISTRKLAKKYNISQSRVCQILKEEHIHYLKREKAANCKGDQMERAHKCCQVLRCHFFPSSGMTEPVLDDESYFY